MNAKPTLGINKKPQLGGDVDAHCGKCKDVREHVIAALNADGQIERVQCRTCQSNHLFRQRATKTTGATATRPSSAARSPRKEVVTEPSLEGPLRKYSMQDRFATGDRIEHPRFGIGVVTEVRPGKIDVKFGRELKTLIHGA